MKRIISVLLAVCLILSASSIALASRGETKRLTLKVDDTQWGHEVSITNCISLVEDSANYYYVIRVEALAILTILDTGKWGTGVGADTEQPGDFPIELYNMKSWTDYDVGDGEYWSEPIFLKKGETLSLTSGIYPTNCVVDVAGEDFSFFVFFEVVDPLTGAAPWAVNDGLGSAVDVGLIPDAFIGNWPQNTNRLQAAEAICRLVEAVTGKTIDAIAAEKGWDMTDTWADTNNRFATFLKVSGISRGLDDINYGVSGGFQRIQMVTMLGRMAESIFGVNLSTFPPGHEKFDDLPTWARDDKYVGWASETGVTRGTSNREFSANRVLTNQETGVFSHNAYLILAGN